jgi:hypothetical protein
LFLKDTGLQPFSPPENPELFCSVVTTRTTRGRANVAYENVSDWRDRALRLEFDKVQYELCKFPL